MRISMGRALYRAARDLMSASSLTSSLSTTTPLLALASACSPAAFSGWRQVAITVSPRAVYCLANSRPSPRSDPVISTVVARAPPAADVTKTHRAAITGFMARIFQRNAAHLVFDSSENAHDHSHLARTNRAQARRRILRLPDNSRHSGLPLDRGEP